MRAPWIGVDFDGTLAEYHGWTDSWHAGQPIMPMVERVQEWLQAGIDVRIVTARASREVGPASRVESDQVINDFCQLHFGRTLPITAEKGLGMIQLWDDRAVHVETNTGRILG